MTETYKSSDESLSQTSFTQDTSKPKGVSSTQYTSGRSGSQGMEGMDTEQMKETASEMYEKGARKMSDTYAKAKEYGFANPGKTILLTLGIGAGIGFWLGSSYRAPTRPVRYARPVVSALTDVAREMFR